MLPLGPSASCCHHSDDGPSLKRSLEGATPTIHASRPLYSRLCRYFVSRLLVLLFTFTPEAHARFLLPLSHSSIPAWRDASTWLSARLPSSHLSRRIWSPSSSNGAKRSSGFSVFSLPPFPGGLDLTCVSAAGLPQDSSLVHAFPSDGAGKPPLLSRTTQAGETAQPRPALGSPGGRILWCMSPERFCSFLPPRRWIRSLAVAHPRGRQTPWVERRSGLRLPPPCGASRVSARQRANALVSFELLCRHHTLSALNAFGQSLAYGRENAGAETRGLTEGLPPFNARVSRSADNATAEKVDELKGAQSPQRSKSEEREHGAPLSLSSPSAALLGKTREAALEELERYERIRDTRLLMSWDAWARGVGKSPEYLKTLVTLAYSSPSASYKVEKRARPAADKRRGLDEARDAQTNASPDSRPAFSLYDDSASAEGGERELEGAEPGCLGTKSQQLEGADRRASDGLSHEAASRGQQAASASGGPREGGRNVATMGRRAIKG
ncbi:hypothetical protein BESB_056570 [Besnoitia besnoiti]|uniref:Uncharacterized protein n=1 Tax=Besnoitia besnoiti TaxID=94643 RepID=A0A2A9MJ61_BESBE|nr:hypothetical protein BESB_056570 [Besnoitia besnoiti]PFH36006.1 hypothetical protein BESB_056570 [Besnoitia besnoiti]